MKPDFQWRCIRTHSGVETVGIEHGGCRCGTGLRMGEAGEGVFSPALCELFQNMTMPIRLWFPLLLLSLCLPVAAPAGELPGGVLQQGGAVLRVAAPASVAWARPAAETEQAARYGVLQPLGGLELRPDSGVGVWQQVEGQLRGRLRIEAAGAQNLSLVFSHWRLPQGAVLRVRSADGRQALPELSDADNPRTGGALHTALLPGEALVVELSLPAHKREALRLRLDGVVWGYRDPLAALQAKSMACQVDVACPQGNAWREQSGAVALYTFHGLACSGSLINTGDAVADAQAPRVVTARQCIQTPEQAAATVFYWGYESPSCRAPGSALNALALQPPGYHARAVQMGGARLLAAQGDTGLAVLELNTRIPAAARAYYSGWDRSGSTPSGVAVIHHPGLEAKRIALSGQAPQTGPGCGMEGGALADSHWRVTGYEQGSTGPGANGAGLWSRDHGGLIGVRSGGAAACGVSDGQECYGRLSAAWEARPELDGMTLRAAFDRSGRNPETMPGRAHCAAPRLELHSAAFSQAPRAGERFELQARASGGAGGYVYRWDADGDGVFERSGSASTVQLSFPERRALNVQVQVQDRAGCTASVSRALEIAGAWLEVTESGPLVELCGNGDARLDPGERFRLPLRLHNRGDAPLAEGAHALFAPQGALRLEAPAAPLSALGPGESQVLNLTLALPADMPCGSALTLDYIATADVRQFSTAFRRLEPGRVAEACRMVETCPAQAAPIEARVGNHYNPQRAGNGFNSHAFGGIWYSADAWHLPSWYSLIGSYRDNLLQAPLQRASNAVSPGTLVPRVTHASVGTGYLARIDAGRLLLAWRFDDGRAGAEHLHLTRGGLPLAASDHTRHWYPPSQSGWGLDVESLRLDGEDRDLALVYFYDANGQPRWVSGEQQMHSHRPHCPGCPHYADWETHTRAVGQIGLFWEGQAAGRIRTDISLPAPLQGQWKRSEVPLKPIGEVHP